MPVPLDLGLQMWKVAKSPRWRGLFHETGSCLIGLSRRVECVSY